MDAGSIDVHCSVVVYEFLCGWCVLNCTGSQQTALITSDTLAQPFTFATGLISSLLCSALILVRLETVCTLKKRRDCKVVSFRLNKTLLIAVVNRYEG